MAGFVVDVLGTVIDFSEFMVVGVITDSNTFEYYSLDFYSDCAWIC